jgi:hypothetical protein
LPVQLRSWLEVSPRHDDVGAKRPDVHADLGDREEKREACKLAGGKHTCEHEIAARES